VIPNAPLKRKRKARLFISRINPLRVFILVPRRDLYPGLRSHNDLVGSLIIAGFTTSLTIVKTISAKADIQLPLAEAAKLFALALFCGHFTLRAIYLAFCNGHAPTVAQS
jgi:hypothetical protein